MRYVNVYQFKGVDGVGVRAYQSQEAIAALQYAFAAARIKAPSTAVDLAAICSVVREDDGGGSGLHVIDGTS